MKLRFALAAANCVALPLGVHSTAQAQPVTGPYVSLGADTSSQYPSNYKYEQSQFIQPAGVTGKLLTLPSYAAVVVADYGFGNFFRVELSGNYYHNTFYKNDQVGYS